MGKEEIIYQEQQKTYFILIVIFIIIAIFLLGMVLLPNFFQKQISLVIKIILLLLTVVDLVMFWSFSKLTIKITSEYLQIGFGVFKRKILIKDINNVKVEDYNKSIYLGYGIRLGRDKSIGFIARAGRGIKLKVIPRDLFFSSNYPEQIKLLIESRIKYV